LNAVFKPASGDGNLQRMPIIKKLNTAGGGLYLTIPNSGGLGPQDQDRTSSFGLFSKINNSFLIPRMRHFSGMQMYTINSLNSGNSGGVAAGRFSAIFLQSSYIFSVIQGRFSTRFSRNQDPIVVLGESWAIKCLEKDSVEVFSRTQGGSIISTPSSVNLGHDWAMVSRIVTAADVCSEC